MTLVLAVFVGADAPRMAQARGRLHLTLGARGTLAFARDDLQRDVEPRALVAREPHRAGAAPPEWAQGSIALEDELSVGKRVSRS